MGFSWRDRSQNIKALSEETFDLVIIGGGITGAGIARDASSRGLKVALVEANDFASGTSSRSSKLVHGGIRYLENLEFSLVFEALSERAKLFKIAPHLVHPLRFLIPIYKGSRVPFWKMRLGMFLYDLLALFRTPEMHASLSPAEVSHKQMHLNEDGLQGAVEYSDAYMDDDRLVIETLRDAHRKGATCVHYVRVEGANWDQDKLRDLQVRDTLTGQLFTLRGKQYVSGVGPWTDIFAHTIDPDWKNKLRPTKGVHLVFSRQRIPIKTAVVMAVETRIIFVIPRHEMVIVGTTDTDFPGNPQGVVAEEEDVTYLLKALNQYFPDLSLSSKDIISSYAGVRPLVYDGAESEGKTSREHSIFHHGPNLSFVAGGKYTTYRLISEEAVDFILKKMDSKQRAEFSSSKTLSPLNPQVSFEKYNKARQDIKKYSERFGYSESLSRRLIERHGCEAARLLDWMKSEYSQYPAEHAMWMAEAKFAIEETMCIRLTDFFWRRTPLFLAEKDHGFQFIDSIVEVFRSTYSWSAEEEQNQRQSLSDSMAHELAWSSNFTNA